MPYPHGNWLKEMKEAFTNCSPRKADVLNIFGRQAQHWTRYFGYHMVQSIETSQMFSATSETLVSMENIAIYLENILF